MNMEFQKKYSSVSVNLVRSSSSKSGMCESMCLKMLLSAGRLNSSHPSKLNFFRLLGKCWKATFSALM